MYELHEYLKDYKEMTGLNTHYHCKYEFGVHKPSVGNLFIPNLTMGGKLKVLYWYIITKANYRIYYVYDKDKLVHTSYCISKIYKFPFMKKGDYIIGPCNTHIDYRGNGIYKHVINKIVNNLKKQDNSIYMVIRSGNEYSRKGAYSCNFKVVKSLTKSKLLKIYNVIN